MELRVLQSVSGGLGTWLDLKTGQTYTAPVSEGQGLGVAACSDKPIITSGNLSYIPNFEPPEDDNE